MNSRNMVCLKWNQGKVGKIINKKFVKEYKKTIENCTTIVPSHYEYLIEWNNGKTEWCYKEEIKYIND